MMPALLGGQLSVGINYVSASRPYFESGRVRALAVSSPDRLPSIAVPTLREQGVDVDFENWRALVAPAEISPSHRRRLESAAQTLADSPEWRDVLARYGWTDRFLTGPPLTRLLADEEARVRELVGRVGWKPTDSLSSFGRYPAVVLSALLAAALMFVNQKRSQRTGVEPSGAGVRSMPLMVLAMLISIATMERLGFIVTASGLFWFTARAFDDAHPVRDAGWAAGLSMAAYVLFAKLLELPLPPGPFAGWL